MLLPDLLISGLLLSLSQQFLSSWPLFLGKEFSIDCPCFGVQVVPGTE